MQRAPFSSQGLDRANRNHPELSEVLLKVNNEHIGTGLPGWLSGKESTCQAGDVGLIPGSGRSSGGGNGNPLSILAWEIP